MPDHPRSSNCWIFTDVYGEVSCLCGASFYDADALAEMMAEESTHKQRPNIHDYPRAGRRNHKRKEWDDEHSAKVAAKHSKIVATLRRNK